MTPVTLPRPQPTTDLAVLGRSTAWVGAAPFRSHLRRLVDDSGEDAGVLALAAGVPPRTVHALLAGPPRGRRRIRARDAARLLNLDRARVVELAATPVRSDDTRRRLVVLDSLGCGASVLARYLRLDAAGVSSLAESEWCSALMELRVAAACGAAGLSGWWSGDAWFDDTEPARRACTTTMRDWAA